MSFFLTFEGVEGSGKTTQIDRLAGHLRHKGYRVLTTREPGGCPIADAIRSILLDSENRLMSHRTELLLYAAARAQHVDEVIAPALARGEVVLCDRYCDATVAYQGFARGLDRGLIDELNALATGGLEPDLTLLLDLPEQAGLQRALARIEGRSENKEDRFEREALDFHRRVRQGYLQLAEGSGRFRIVDASGSQEEVTAGIRSAVDAFLCQREAP